MAHEAPTGANFAPTAGTSASRVSPSRTGDRVARGGRRRRASVTRCHGGCAPVAASACETEKLHM
eukprot:7313749-Prymnesium_polylepis.1